MVYQVLNPKPSGLSDEEKALLASLAARKSKKYAEWERGQLAGIRRRGNASERASVDRLVPPTGDTAPGRRTRKDTNDG